MYIEHVYVRPEKSIKSSVTHFHIFLHTVVYKEKPQKSIMMYL